MCFENASVRSHDRERNRGTRVTRDRQLRGRALGRGDEGESRRRLGLADDERHAGIAPLADRLVNRNPPEKRNAEIAGHLLAAAVAEDISLVLAVTAHEVAHVLDDAERRDVELFVHRDRAARIRQRHLLRRRHDNRARNGHRLAEAQRDVARPRRHVDRRDSRDPPTRTSRKNCWTAPWSIGPRQMIGASSPVRNPIEIDLQAVLFCRDRSSVRR